MGYRARCLKEKQSNLSESCFIAAAADTGQSSPSGRWPEPSRVCCPCHRQGTALRRQGKGLASCSDAARPPTARCSAEALRAGKLLLPWPRGSQQIWDLFLPCTALQEGCQGNLSPSCLALLICPSRRRPQMQKGTFPFYCLCSLPATDLHNSIIVYKHLISFTLPQ